MYESLEWGASGIEEERKEDIYLLLPYPYIYIPRDGIDTAYPFYIYTQAAPPGHLGVIVYGVI
jgi:hypothetical protein